MTTRPVIIGHRGASGYRPEHTLASYELAARLGADFLEPDLVATADGVLVARHENEIGGSTDIASRPEFADRRTTKVVDGWEITGWFTEDLTLTELRTLWARERIPQLRPHNTSHDLQHRVPTLLEIIDLADQLTTELGRPIGVYPETKHPSYFASLELPLEPPLLDALASTGRDRPDADVFVQSFETGNLRWLAERLPVPLVQLLSPVGAPYDLVAAGDARGYADLATPAGLAEIATYASAIGPDKTMVIGWDADDRLGAPTSLVADAHKAGLVVHPYTFRAENAFLPVDYRRSGELAEHDGPGKHGGVAELGELAEHGDLVGELAAYFALGVDGVFTDHPDLAVAARAAIGARERR